MNRKIKTLSAVVGCWLLLWAVVFHDALLSAVDVWLANDTFNHCFLVVPGVLYAVWQQRGAVLARAPGYSWLGALGVAAVIFVYALGQAAYVELLQHLAIFGMLPAMALFLFGGEVLEGFAFTMIVGVISGTYSTIFIAAAAAIVISVPTPILPFASRFKVLGTNVQAPSANAMAYRPVTTDPEASLRSAVKPAIRKRPARAANRSSVTSHNRSGSCSSSSPSSSRGSSCAQQASVTVLLPQSS